MFLFCYAVLMLLLIYVLSSTDNVAKTKNKENKVRKKNYLNYYKRLSITIFMHDIPKSQQPNIIL